jgi:hypothetical protein
VTSRPVNPVPPVEMTTSIFLSAGLHVVPGLLDALD